VGLSSRQKSAFGFAIFVMTEPATGRWLHHFETALMPLEILNRPFVFLRRSLAVERAEIFSFARSRISLAGIQPILAGFQFPNHAKVISNYSLCSAGY
jgi:hypothetical protein